MHAGPSSSLSRRLAVAAGLAVAFASVGGCNTDRYDDAIVYPVRSDWIVAGISTLQPAGFNRPGAMPTDTLRLPDKELSPDAREYRTEVEKKNVLDPMTLPAAQRAEYAQLLGEMFGTPARPKVAGFDEELLKKADEKLTPAVVAEALDVGEEKLAQGSKLYRQHCLHCHGLEGNGRGPTGYWVNPHPRDYRQGVYKFTSSSQDLGQRKPRRDDLMHVLLNGIEGSSMPSFGILARADLDAIISYIIHLSIRGEVEYLTMKDLLKEGRFQVEGENPTLKQALQQYQLVVVNDWMTAQKPETAIQPDPYPYENTEDAFLASAARGSKLFNEGDASCVSCHKNYGREAPYSYDVWGTIVRPRNFYDGIHRGGKRPLDLYYRVFSGINGVGMTSYTSLRPSDEEKAKKVDKIWDLVNFMRALPYPDLRAKLREKYNVTNLE